MKIEKYNLIIIISAIVAIILLPSCAPDKFILNQNDKYQISGFMMSGIDGVEVIGENAIILNEGARASLRSPGLTQLRADFTVELLKGEGVKLSLRSASYHFKAHPASPVDRALAARG